MLLSFTVYFVVFKVLFKLITYFSLFFFCCVYNFTINFAVWLRQFFVSCCCFVTALFDIWRTEEDEKQINSKEEGKKNCKFFTVVKITIVYWQLSVAKFLLWYLLGVQIFVFPSTLLPQPAPYSSISKRLLFVSICILYMFINIA